MSTSSDFFKNLDYLQPLGFQRSLICICEWNWENWKLAWPLCTLFACEPFYLMLFHFEKNWGSEWSIIIWTLTISSYIIHVTEKPLWEVANKVCMYVLIYGRCAFAKVWLYFKVRILCKFTILLSGEQGWECTRFWGDCPPVKQRWRSQLKWNIST